MAFNDTLFQLGMDLTRSSTTHAEEFGTPSSLSRSVEVLTDQNMDRDGTKFAGTHLVIDVFGAKNLDSLAVVEAALESCVEAAGAASLHSHLHHTIPGKGVSGVAVLEGGHISVHTWPSAGYAAFDVFLGHAVRPHAITAVLRRAFEARDVVIKEQKRGDEAGLMDTRIAAVKRAPARLPVRVARQPKARVQAA
jgi:S-adenosylmethionine decarboxylase